ncbi:50S ribosomal protein L13 [Candidatus Woesearchaeota archaeon]|nr:50S ribosomal protein L13 [Candidatus Woesearchaeota archaeon]
MIIDAENLLIGRFATVVAKKAILGEKIDVINCSKAIVSGKKSEVLAKYKTRSIRGSATKGPFIPKIPERFVKRAIRGMLPYKKPHGRAAFERIICHRGVPQELEGKKAETIKEANHSKLPTLNYVTVEEICKYLGGKI